ncbi:hypothetical protein ALC60_04851 [Trachymyrmex zeteki]|uniref:Uncharacterized protein n=1 Tax=Mycetomoellerius zeteki TaxID=64791 RepID=A0A151X788_9HYME|nr:hypothetical protein ALC60_04851 [Trachymyrmex zeteki]
MRSYGYRALVVLATVLAHMTGTFAGHDKRQAASARHLVMRLHVCRTVNGTSNGCDSDGRLVTVFERKSAVSEIANVSVHIDLEYYARDSSSASMTDFTLFRKFLYTTIFMLICIFQELRIFANVSNSKNTESSRFATSCMRKACLKRNFKVEGVEAERNMVQGERDSTKRDSVHRVAILGKVSWTSNKSGREKRALHSTECCTVKFVPNIPISRDEAESENHLSQRGLLSVAAPTSSGSEKPFFAHWHPPQE